MKMWLGSRHWCITISISKGATRLPCPKRLLVVSCVRCVILMSWTTEGVYPNFLFHSCSDPAYYSVSGPLLVVAWIGRIFMALGANVTLSAFGVELFPTSSRSTAAGMRLVFLTLGGSLGLLLEALLYGVVASHWVAIGALALLALPGAFLVARCFPETAGRTLDEIAPERT